MTIDAATIDAAHLRAKYEAERVKRLNAPAGRKFRRLEEPGHAVDPFTPVQPRDTINDDVTFTFVGGGFSGLITCARVKQAVPDAKIRIIDQAGDFGGVWYWNRYPGAMCDTAAMIYLPLLEETGHMPTQKYVMGPEIHEHSQRIGKHFDLYKHALFHTAVTGAKWDEGIKRWRVTTNRGDEFTSKYLSIGNGPLSVAQLPDIPGVESFKGKAFHTSRWEYEYTGGDRNGGALTGLKDKRVAIIGTGATAVQCIPELAKYAKELLVFQRTPSAVDIRNNHKIDPEWFKSVTKEPGWQDKWLENFTTCWGLVLSKPDEMLRGEYEDLVQDGWSELALRRWEVMKNIPLKEFSMERLMTDMTAADDENTERIRKRVDEIVKKDPKTAAGLKAWYYQLCKRPTFHDEYLQCFNNDNVKLIDTDGQGVDKITETGIHANGETYDVDCIIYASGFEFGATSYSERLGFDIEGYKGPISQVWADHMKTYHGLQANGFPNLFFAQLQQGAFFAANAPHNFVESALAVAGVVKYMEENSKETVEPDLDAQTAWVQFIYDHGRSVAREECTPGYYNNEGNIEDKSKYEAGYPPGPTAYFKMKRDWTKKGLETGQFDGVVFA